MRAGKMFLVACFLLACGGTVAADCRQRSPTERKINVKVLKWKTLANGQNWTSFFVETPEVCYPKTGAPQAYLLSCNSRYGCPNAKKDVVYHAALVANEIRAITVDKRYFRVTSVLMPCALSPPIVWSPIKNNLYDTVQCATAPKPPVPASPAPSVSSPPIALTNTVWYHQDAWLGGDSGIKLGFYRNQLLSVTLPNGRWVAGIWNQKGDQVMLKYGKLRVTAIVKGDRMEGTQTAAGSTAGAWLAIRRAK